MRAAARSVCRCRLTLAWIVQHPELSARMLTALAWSLFAGLSTGAPAPRDG